MLTEYEEHRLRTNIEQGQSLFVCASQFELATIDEALNSLKLRAKPHGEIITYLPTGEGADADSIELDILMASQATARRAALSCSATSEPKIEEVPRRRRGARIPSDHRFGAGSPTPIPEARRLSR